MNAHTNTTKLVEAATLDPLAPNGPQSLAIDMERLKALPLERLVDLREAIHTIGEVTSGLMCQPRFLNDEDNVMTPVCEVLDDIRSLMDGFEEGIVNIAKAATPTTRTAAAARGWLLVSYEADMRDDLSMVNVAAATALVDLQTGGLK